MSFCNSSILSLSRRSTLLFSLVLFFIIFAARCTDARSRTPLDYRFTPSRNSNLLRNAVTVGVQSAVKSSFLCNAKKKTNTQSSSHHHVSDRDYSNQQNNILKCSSKPINTASAKQLSTPRLRRSHSYDSSTNPADASFELKPTTVATQKHTISKLNGGGGGVQGRNLVFWENMVCGAISRSVAQVVVHPMNTMKTILQANRRSNSPAAAANGVLTSVVGETVTFRTLAHPSNWKLLTRGAGAQFLLSVPHGALNFAVLEFVRRRMNIIVEQRIIQQREETNNSKSNTKKKVLVSSAAGPGLDFLSSCISTICCSVISTPQMMITDTIMAGIYPNLSSACKGLMSQRNGLLGFYTGWWPGLAGKIPSYALTWTAFQQLKVMHQKVMKRPPKDIENSIMGCIAAATTVCVMIPMDTIKTRVVTANSVDPYKGIIDAAFRMTREEGLGCFYRGLTPRLMSVVPMIGIQFGVYEYTKKFMLARTGHDSLGLLPQAHNDQDIFDEITMEVAADAEQPFPAPYIISGDRQNEKIDSKKKMAR